MAELPVVMQVMVLRGYLVVGYNQKQKLGNLFTSLKDAQGNELIRQPFVLSKKTDKWDALEQVILMEELTGSKLPPPASTFYYRVTTD